MTVALFFFGWCAVLALGVCLLLMKRIEGLEQREKMTHEVLENLIQHGELVDRLHEVSRKGGVS